jgi:hypothetical protein
MVRRNIFHMAINPLESIEADLVKKASDILKKNAYEVRLLLSGKTPKIIAHFDSEIDCQQNIKALSMLGISAFAVSDSEIRTNSQLKFSAHSLINREGQVIFISRGIAQQAVSSGDIYLIIFGKVQRSVMFEETRSSMKINIPATLLTGGIPVWRKSTENVEKKSFRNEYFTRLYRQTSDEPVIEISELSFDFSCLGNRISPSSSKNIQELVVELQRLFVGALFDSKLAECSPSIEEDEIESKCKLIFLSYRAHSRA